MEEKPEIEISETNRGREQIIVDKKYKFNLSKTKKDNSKVYRCTEYKTLNRCKSYIILNDKREVLKYENLHDHLEKEVEASISLAKHKFREEIRKSSDPSDIKPKRTFNQISKEMGFLCPQYKTIKSQISRSIKKLKRSNDSNTKATNDSNTKATNDSNTKATNDSNTKATNDSNTKATNDSNTKAKNDSNTKAKNDSNTKATNDSNAKDTNDSNTKATNDSNTKATNDSNTKDTNQTTKITKNDGEMIKRK
jgi:membrane protein involved in colicin uptake